MNPFLDIAHSPLAPVRGLAPPAQGSPNGAHTARAVSATPRLQAHSNSLEGQIAGILAARTAPAATDRPDLLALRYTRLVRMYRDLALAGEALENVRALGERHALVLLRHWRDHGRAAATIRSGWSILRAWFQAIGKPECVKRLRHHWPEAPRAAVDHGRPKTTRHGDCELIASLRGDRDATHYHVERLCQVLRLSVQDALLFPVFDPATCPPDSTRGRKFQAARRTAPEAVAEVLQAAAAFVAQRSRPTLLWPKLNLTQAARRHENRLAYLRRTRADCDDVY